MKELIFTVSSELVRVERIRRKAERERLLLEIGRDALKTCGDILAASLKSDATSLLLSLGAIELARKQKLVGDEKAVVIQGVLVAAFTLHGFQGGVA